jgi:putative flippase GtrA
MAAPAADSFIRFVVVGVLFYLFNFTTRLLYKSLFRSA